MFALDFEAERGVGFSGSERWMMDSGRSNSCSPLSGVTRNLDWSSSGVDGITRTYNVGNLR